MALFHYHALDALGKKKQGFIEAHSEKEAKNILREQGLMLREIALKTHVESKQNLKGEALVTFTIQLSQLVSAEIPIYESLMALEEQYRNEPFHRVILSLCEQVKAGSSLSEAMAAFPDSFDKLYRAMIAAGESIGGLNVVLDRLSLLLTKQLKLKKQIITALIYPTVLASFSLLIIGVLIGFVLPSIEGIFAERKLNGFTSFVLGVSYYARTYWWLYIPSIAAFITYATMKLKSPAGKLWLQRNLLKVPILRTLVINTSVARFCRTMGTLQQGGLPIIDSLRNAREVIHNVVIEEDIQHAENKIIEGSSLSHELSRSKYIPTIVCRMLAVGEESGNLVTMLNKLADMYEEEVEKTLDRVVALAQPLILIFMGTMIGIILMAILLPLTDISSLAV